MKKKNILLLLTVFVALSATLTNCRKPELREVKEMPIESFAQMIPSSIIVFSTDTFFTMSYTSAIKLYTLFDNSNPDNNNNPDLPLYYPKGIIKAIHIYSDSSYDANHPAGTYLDDIVTIAHTGTTNYYFNTTIDNYPMRLDSFNLLKPHCEYLWILHFTSPPDVARKHFLVITMDLASGEHYEDNMANHYYRFPVQITAN